MAIIPAQDDLIQRMKGYLKPEIGKYFGNEAQYSFLTGSRLNGTFNDKSDIDLVIIVSNSFDKKNARVVGQFQSNYLEHVGQTGLRLDPEYPFELVKRVEIEDAVDYKGFDIVDGRLSENPIHSNSDWLVNDREHRLWRKMIAQEHQGFISGDYELYNHHKNRSWSTELKYYLSTLGQEYVHPEQLADFILSAGRERSGLKITSRATFTFYYGVPFAEAWNNLIVNGILFECDKKFRVNLEALRMWEKEVIKKSGILN
mgnify:CR=1 FL=1